MPNTEKTAFEKRIMRQIYGHRAKAKRYNCQATLTLAEWIEILAEHNGVCFYCKTYFGEFLTIDHRIPLSKQGGHTRDNVIPACHSCNTSKQAAAEDSIRKGYALSLIERTDEHFTVLDVSMKTGWCLGTIGTKRRYGHITCVGICNKDGKTVLIHQSEVEELAQESIAIKLFWATGQTQNSENLDNFVRNYVNEWRNNNK